VIATSTVPAATTVTDGTGRRGRARAGALVAAAAAIASAGVLSACGSSASSATSASGGTAASTAAVSLATSLSTAEDSWAVVPVSANPAFWEVLVRPAKSAAWRLVTPPGVADNGGLVATGAGSALTVAVRPTQDLEFSPLSTTADAGATWSTDGPLSAGVAASPDALAAFPSAASASESHLVALLSGGAIETSSDAGNTWVTIAKPGAIAASPAGKACGRVVVSAVSFGPTAGQVLAAGSCGAGGTTAIFAYSGGAWQRLRLPVTGQLERLTSGVALERAKAGLTELWAPGTGWYAYAPLSNSKPPTLTGWRASAPLPTTGQIAASGTLVDGGVWVLLPGGQAATIDGPGQQWLLLPPLPAAAKVLASGPGSAIDALAVSGAKVTVWQLAKEATLWAKVQTISVPIQYGSSS